MTAADEDVRFLQLRQPGARRRLLETPLEEIRTVAEFLQILADLDQVDWMDERGLR